MAHDSWYERLEAYLDGELDANARAAFEEESATRADWSAELKSRLRFRDEARQALRGEVPEDLFTASNATEVSPGQAPARVLPFPRYRLRPLLALAAVLVLAILAPRLLRNQQGAVGPRSTITIDGPVTALGYGETPHQTTRLEAGCFDLAAGVCR
jgi:anti-sigma factor RsiW